jgi:glutathione S-transferase
LGRAIGPVGEVGYNYFRSSIVTAMEAKLYVILGSHSCRTGMLMLDHKGIPYRRVEVPTGLHPLALRLLGFEGNAAPLRSTGERPNRPLGTLDRMGTVPALRMRGERVKTNRAIARFLDQHNPDPPLFPDDPRQRSAVEEAERWGDEILQMAARRLVLAATVRGRHGLVDRGDEGRLGPLLYRGAATRAPPLPEGARPGTNRAEPLARTSPTRSRSAALLACQQLHQLRLRAGWADRSGRFAWIDGEPVVFREFVSDLLATQGVAPPSRSIPAWAASARDQLDYAPVKTIADGLAELRAA